MAEGSGNRNTAIWVAVITVVGGLLTAFIANADKWLPREEAPAEASPAASTAAGADAKQQGEARAAPATGAEPEAAARAPGVEPIDLSGTWRSEGGDRMRFDQTGSRYQYYHTAGDGSFRSSGRGTLSGRALSHSFEAMDGGTGTCTAEINAAGNRISGHCATRAGGWDFAVER